MCIGPRTEGAKHKLGQTYEQTLDTRIILTAVNATSLKRKFKTDILNVQIGTFIRDNMSMIILPLTILL